MRRYWGFAAIALAGAAFFGAMSAPGAAPLAPPLDLAQQRRLLELGGYLGIFHPSSSHELFERGTTHEEFDAAITDLGVRLSYLHFFFLGAEAELGVMPTGTSAGAALLYTARFHALTQFPVWKGLTPFFLLGGGFIGVASSFSTVGTDADPAFHWGMGLKYYLTRAIALRADFRHVISSGVGFGNADHFEFLLGAAWVIGWRGDADGDGLFDPDDRCPREVSYRADGCPPIDRDGDGVVDEHDKCPERRGVDADGCPPEEEDPDGDGVAGQADKCPRKAETFNGFEDDDGCPDELPDPLKAFNSAVQGVVTFPSGRIEIGADSRALLDRAAEVLKKHPKLRLLLRGHTDNVGKAETNIALSERRAETVKAYLVAAGIDAARITVEGVGPAEPAGDNATADGRALNRRIELRASLDESR